MWVYSNASALGLAKNGREVHRCKGPIPGQGSLGSAVWPHDALHRDPYESILQWPKQADLCRLLTVWSTCLVWGYADGLLCTSCEDRLRANLWKGKQTPSDVESHRHMRPPSSPQPNPTPKGQSTLQACAS